MARILVTGAGGFLGAEVAAALAARGDQVIGFDIRVGPRLAELAESHAGVEAVLGEITEWPVVTELLLARRPEAVVHCAAIVGVKASVEAPIKTMRVNVEGALNLFEAMRLAGTRRVIHISSEEVYGPFQAPAAAEDHPQNPVMAYGVSKLAVEHLGRAYQARHGLDCINLRTCWVYGAGLPRPRVPMTLVDAALAGRALHIPGGGGMAVDHTYVKDAVAGVLAALDLPKHPFDVYNIGSGQAPTVAEIVDVVKELVPGARLSVGPGDYLHGDGVPAVKKGALDIPRR